MRQFNRGDTVTVTIRIEAELYSEHPTVTQEDLVNMLFDDNSYGLKSVCGNDQHELLYRNVEIGVDTDNSGEIGES